MSEVYWSGDPGKCWHGCKLGSVFYDFRVPGGTRWAIGCHNHFRAHQGKLGTGAGQKYKRQADGRWLKVAG